MQGRFNPAELVLPWRPVTKNGVNVAVNQARADAALLCINGRDRMALVAVLCLAKRDNQPVVDNQGVPIKNGLVNIPKQQQTDVFDDDLAGCFSGL